MEAVLNKAEAIKLLEIDPWLKPFEYDIGLRMDRYSAVKRALLGDAPNLKAIANGHLFFGFHPADGGWYYREWAPGAQALNLIGDFNEWNTKAHPLNKKENGCWEIFIPGEDALAHMSRVKVRVKANGISRDRIPLYIKRIDKDSGTGDFAGQIWQPPEPFRWTDGDFYVDHSRPLFIYEAHVGMSQEKEGIGTFKEFTDNMLCRVKANGYNTIQLMAVMEHPYYGSFGYQVSNFFAVSSWMGTPDDLKELINTAHSMGITVLLDLVHSHSVKNFAEGINEFDGTEYQFFHSGSRGDHPAWDSKLFNYGKHEVIHFLLSNIKFWLEEYHFDGFRFDGITSMLYKHHGLGVAFDNYKKYFSMDTDLDAVTYLQFANELIREVRPDAVTIAEDMSGMPGMCLPIEYGGIGFDYRLAMGVPDFWISTLRKCSDEEWSMHRMWHELTTRRAGEKNIGYAESHDQAMVGDKTIIFWLADKEMYWHMAKGDNSLHIDRAISLHKLIRFITMTLAGEGYLNFMGNEFGHPEWIDFPREGNGWSYKYARRQWSLAENRNLKYEYLYAFDRDMISFAKSYNIPGTGYATNLWIDERDKIMAYSKSGVVFLFNFNPSTSFTQFGIPVEEEGEYRVVFDTDDKRFGGQSRIARDIVYRTTRLPEKGDKPGIIIYSPSRTALALEKV
ncbi:1,4-alpha-glucan branching enzyme [Anaerobacterium chartisolvens]|uniref:1,4-alpha-glucan branching enzyme n=1 Tax=Anaerobacterium chartisolvens TaxID=1297424 RepID=A0A369BF03_9FIRM|nr:alpha-amylase family glycosyl hydrolase [Anaerobacterium chartisolvens]RCX20122.1 1,4-alpha-glucan branching enzyme [Anaerobacterium chartisolvens]